MPENEQNERRVVTVVATRPWEPGTHAVVTAELLTEEEASAVPGHVTCFDAEARASAPSLSEGDVLKRLVIKSVTHWIQSSESGRAAWANSSEDFNVGDLSSELGDEGLGVSLYLHGISSLEIETHSNKSGATWEYDTLLYDGD